MISVLLVDIHKQKASQIFNISVDEVTPEQRRVGKTANFQEMYGTPIYFKCISDLINVMIHNNPDNLTEYDFAEMEKRIVIDWRNEIMKKAIIKKDQYRGGQDTSSRKVSCPYCEQAQYVTVTFEQEKEHTCKSCGNLFLIRLEV